MTIRFDTSVSGAIGLNASASAPAQTPPDEAPAAGVMPEVAELQLSGDPGAMLAALTMTAAKNEQKVARQQRDQAMSAQEKMEAAEIQDLHDKANLQRAQGLVDGAMQIGQAAMSFGASMKSLAADNLKDCASAANNDAQAERQMVGDYENLTNGQRIAMNDYAQQRDNDAIALKGQANGAGQASAECKAAGDLLGAARSIADGLFSGALTDKDADEKAHEASADAFKQIAADAHDDENDAKQLMEKALDFYKEYVDTKNQTVMAALQRA